MREEVETTTDPLFLGLTRPPMIWGVPYASFIFTYMVTIMAFLASGSFLAFLMALPMHAVAFLLALRDPRIFDLILVRARSSRPHANRAFWGAASYQP